MPADGSAPRALPARRVTSRCISSVSVCWAVTSWRSMMLVTEASLAAAGIAALDAN